MHDQDPTGLNAPARELLAAIVDSSDDAIVSKTLGGVITSWNPAAERIFGYSAEEAIGRPITMLFPPDRVPEEGHLLAEIGAGRRVRHFETERVRKDGRRIPVSVTLSPIRNAEGVIVGASKIVRDTSERARLERRAAEAAADLERILSSVGEGIAALDSDLRYLFINDAGLQMLGLPREAVIGRTPRDLFPAEVSDQMYPHLRSALATSNVVGYEMHMPGADRWYENRLYPSADGLSVFFTEITARRKAEAALRESRDVLALAMRGGRMGAWSRNLATGELWWSREFEEIFGLAPGGFKGTDAGFLAYVHEEDRPRVQAALEGAIQARRDYIVEFRFRHAGGAWRWMEGRGRVVFAADGRPVSLNGIGIDITERKAVEAELADARDSAEAANRAKDDFMAMLGHELRNPLSPILTALQLMKLRGGDASDRERTVIERQVNHLTRLVDDLLDVSRIARGKVELRLQPIEIADVIARAIEIASPVLEERTHVFTADIPRTGLAVDADVARLAQVISNLLTNAAKYTPPGGRVSVAAARERDEVVVRVRDNGMGIVPDVLPRIFGLFVQGPRAIDRAQGGLGLGLTIVKNLVEAHGGRVSAHSDGIDRGSEFIVRLPAATTAESGESPAAGEAMPVRVTAARVRVLIVDDNADAATMIAEALRFSGFETCVAHDGPGALAQAPGFRPHAAFLDIGLPVMDGYELAGRLREIPGLGSLKLIAVTGYGQESDRVRSAAAGFEHHLVKPVDLDALEALLADTPD